MSHPIQTSDLEQNIAKLKQDLNEATARIGTNPDPYVRRLDEIHSRSLQTHIAHLETQLHAQANAQPKTHAAQNPKPNHLEKMGDLDETLHKWNAKIAEMKQANESMNIYTEIPTESEGSLDPLLTDEEREITEADIPAIPPKPLQAMSVPPLSPPPVILSPPINPPSIEIPPLFKKIQAEPPKAPPVIPQTKQPEPKPPTTVSPPISPSMENRSVSPPVSPSSDTKVSPQTAPKTAPKPETRPDNPADQLKAILLESETVAEAENESPTEFIEPQEPILSNITLAASNTHPQIPSSGTSPKTPSGEPKESVSMTEDPTGSGSYGQQIEYMFRKQRYQLFKLHPENADLKRLLAPFDFIAVRSRKSPPFFKDIYLDLICVKIIDSDAPLILDQNIEGIRFESVDTPSVSDAVFTPLNNYIALRDAFGNARTAATESNNLCIALTKCLNIEWLPNQWVYQKHYAYLSLSCITVLKHPIKATQQQRIVEIKDFAQFSEIQAYYLAQTEVTTFLAYTQAKFDAMFRYNAQSLHAPPSSDLTLSVLRYKMLLYIFTSGMMVAAAVVVLIFTDPLIYWIMLGSMFGVIGGLSLGIKIYQWKTHIQNQRNHIHHSLAQFSTQEIPALTERVEDTPYKAILTREIASLQPGRAWAKGKKERVWAHAHPRPKGTKTEAQRHIREGIVPQPAAIMPAKVHALNKQQMIQNFLSE